jgi:hypothetical protein
MVRLRKTEERGGVRDIAEGDENKTKQEGEVKD